MTAAVTPDELSASSMQRSHSASQVPGGAQCTSLPVAEPARPAEGGSGSWVPLPLPAPSRQRTARSPRE